MLRKSKCKQPNVFEVRSLRFHFIYFCSFLSSQKTWVLSPLLVLFVYLMDAAPSSPFWVVHLLTFIKVPTTKPRNKYLFFFFFIPISFGFMLLPHSLESSARQWYWNKELTLESLTFGSLEIMGFAAIIKKVDAKCSLFLVEASISCLTPAWALIMFHSLDPSFFASSPRFVLTANIYLYDAPQSSSPYGQLD